MVSRLQGLAVTFRPCFSVSFLCVCVCVCVCPSLLVLPNLQVHSRWDVRAARSCERGKGWNARVGSVGCGCRCYRAGVCNMHVGLNLLDCRLGVYGGVESIRASLHRSLHGGRIGAGPIEAERQSAARAGTHHDVYAKILCCCTVALRRHQDASTSRLSNLRITAREQPSPC